MATIINNPPAATEQSSFTAFIIAAIAILVCTVVVVLYVLPALRDRDAIAADAALEVVAPQTQGTITSEVTAEPLILTSEQRTAIQELGVDPAQIPTTVSLDQVACFEDVLGAGRVAEIRSGAVPSEFEFFKVQGCI